jgi:hypothetical protein
MKKDDQKKRQIPRVKRSPSQRKRSTARPRSEKPLIPPELVRDFTAGLFEEELHAKRVESLANAVIGVTQATSVSVQAIGHGLATALGKKSKHAIKQVDRLLSNAGVDPWKLFEQWVPYVFAERTEAIVALDWTEFEPDDHVTCAAHLVTSHGRSTALVWKTIRKSELKGRRTEVENRVIDRLHEIVPPHVHITLLADRGFAAADRFVHLTTLGWDYVIRFRQNTLVKHGEVTQPAADWVPKNGRARMLRDVQITGQRTPIESVVCVHKRGMKQAWCLATNRADLSAAQVAKLYGRRFTIEESFRDQKDLRFGLGLSATHIRDCGRRDRLLLLTALAHALLTLLGAAAEAIGFDRMMKANTVKHRTHSLFRQGCYWFSRIPNLPEKWLVPLLQEFERQLAQHAVFRALFGIL